MVSIDMILAQWEAAGVFDYMLPFLFIFAIVFGILTTTNIFGANRGVYVTISLVVALLSLRLGFVQDFFREAFPRLGVAIAVIFIAVVLIAIFIPDAHKSGWAIGFYVFASLAFIYVILNSFGSVGYFGRLWHEEFETILVVLLFVGAIVAISLSGKSKGGGGKDKGGSAGASFSKWRREE